jgi:hypothetical protein
MVVALGSVNEMLRVTLEYICVSANQYSSYPGSMDSLFAKSVMHLQDDACQFTLLRVDIPH